MKKFEFILYINGNIVVQRYFMVKHFNPQSIKSLDVKYCVDNCVGMIEKSLRDKTSEYLHRTYNPYKEQTTEEIPLGGVFDDEEDVFDFEIKTDDRLVVKRRFSGNVYPQRVRYSVDIRKIIPDLITEIQETFSEENLSVEYCGISL